MDTAERLGPLDALAQGPSGGLRVPQGPGLAKSPEMPDHSL